MPSALRQERPSFPFQLVTSNFTDPFALRHLSWQQMSVILEIWDDRRTPDPPLSLCFLLAVAMDQYIVCFPASQLVLACRLASMDDMQDLEVPKELGVPDFRSLALEWWDRWLRGALSNWITGWGFCRAALQQAGTSDGGVGGMRIQLSADSPPWLLERHVLDVVVENLGMELEQVPVPLELLLDVLELPGNKLQEELIAELQRRVAASLQGNEPLVPIETAVALACGRRLVPCPKDSELWGGLVESIALQLTSKRQVDIFDDCRPREDLWNAVSQLKAGTWQSLELQIRRPSANLSRSLYDADKRVESARLYGDVASMNYCAYRQSYTEGSSIEGYRFTDYVSLGDEFQQNPPVKVQMGCHSRETKLFVTQKANGILGLAPSKDRMTTMLMNIFKDKAHVNAAVFAMCLSSQGGLLTVGGFNESLNTATVQWIPLTLHGFYSVSLLKMIIEGPGGSELSGGFGHTIVDSGTTYTYLPDGLYRELKETVKSYCKQHNGCAAQGTSGTEGIGTYPRSWYPSSYLYRRSGELYCLGFESNGAARQTVLGATWMIGRNIIFDTETPKLGVADASCPSFVERPPGPTKTVLLGGSSSPTGSQATYKDHRFRPPIAIPDITAATLFMLTAFMLMTLGLCLVMRNLLRAHSALHRAPAMASPASGRRSLRARKLGRSSPAQDEELEEMQSLASSPQVQSDGEWPSSPVEGTRIPVETWLRNHEADERSGDSATAGSGSDVFSEGPLPLHGVFNQHGFLFPRLLRT
eukprot:s128_g27.t1